MIKAMVFDMDGTILDSMSYWRRINIDFLKDRGLEPPTEIRADLMSITNRVCAQVYSREYGLNMTVDDILAEYRQRMSRYYATVIKPKPFAGEYIDKLKAEGIRVCLGTATPRELAYPALDRHGLWDKFEFIASGMDMGINKESALYYESVADMLGLACGECGMFEDSLYAMKGAKEAGMKVYGIYEPVHEARRDEITAICDVYVKSFSELMNKSANP